jgi:hypothetical protein
LNLRLRIPKKARSAYFLRLRQAIVYGETGMKRAKSLKSI